METSLNFPDLHTSRLRLRELDDADVDAVFHIFKDPNVTQFYNIPTFARKSDARRLLQRRQDRFYEEKGICWGITLRDEDAIIGTCGFNAWHKRGKVGDLGYELARPFWNQGLMTEALTAVVAYGFERLAVAQQRAWVMPKNKASGRVLLKIGFQSEGIQLARGYWDSAFHDLELFTKTIDNPPDITFPI